jgi:hypothetical protein
MINKVFLFIILNFFVGFFSDIVLNFLSTNYGIIKSLQPYFYHQSVLKCAFDAGLTIVIALIITMLVTTFLLGYTVPFNLYSLGIYCIYAFCLGYLMDILIEKMKIFGNRLDAYYKQVGGGFWGGLAFVFSILISYFIQTKILPLL